MLYCRPLHQQHFYAQQGWARGADQVVGGESYASFTTPGSTAQLLIDLDLTRQVA